MLVVANLLDEETYQEAVNFMSEKDGEEGRRFMAQMDATSECLTLSTGGFDGIPPEAQENLKKTMEILMARFGTLLLSATHLSLGFGNTEPARIIYKGLEEMGDKINKMMLGG